MDEDQSMTQLFDPDKFWDYSNQLYGQAGVKECCLTLQNHHGADINLLLLCCWIDQHQLVISEVALQRLIKLSQDWQTGQLYPLRTARAKLDRGSMPYLTALNHELNAEKKEQSALIDLLNQPQALNHKQPFSTGTNCVAYAGLKPFPLEEFSALTSAFAK